MEMSDAIRPLAALAHEGRLSVFRLLVRMAPKGARPTEIAAMLGLKQNTLSHHLAALEEAGLITSVRHGRSLDYAVCIDRVDALLGYLAHDCCRGRPALCADSAAPALLSPLRNTDPAMDPTVSKPAYDVLFLCSANSARSLMAEAILNHLGQGRFRAHSAGTRPAAEPHPQALALLRQAGIATTGLRSKPLANYCASDAAPMDFIFTVCDAAAAEECAPWPGQPVSANWGLPDPAKATGTDAERALAFTAAYSGLYRRIAAFVALPIEQLDRVALQRGIDRIALDQKDTA